MFFGPCPVHGGDNPMGLNLYPEGESVPYWRCNTRHCERNFPKTIIGFVRGVLSHHKFNWSKQGERSVSHHDAVDWCCEFLGTNIHLIAVNYSELSKKKFTSTVSLLSPFHDENKPILSRDQVRKFLQIPSEYFQNRGWSKSILDRYDVGYYPYQNRALSNRVVVPIYDENHQNVIGFTGRSIYEKCAECGLFHKDACPKTDQEIKRSSKWFNQGFSKENVLFNFWYARRVIQKSGVVILTEGPMDVLKLEMANVHNGLALLGTDLSDKQQILLEMSGAMDVVVLTDMDGAGREASEKLKKRLGRCFRLHFPDWPYEDVGATPIEVIIEVLKQYAK